MKRAARCRVIKSLPLSLAAPTRLKVKHLPTPAPNAPARTPTGHMNFLT